MGREFTSPNLTVAYGDRDAPADDYLLPAKEPANPCHEPTLGRGQGPKGRWRSAPNPISNQLMTTETGPELGRAGLHQVSEFGAPRCSPVVHANHYYHIVGYDARKNFQKSVAYQLLKAKGRALGSVTLYDSVG